MHNAIGYACIYVDFVVKNIEQVPPLIIRDIYIKAIYYFPVSYFCFATSQNCILAELRLPTVIRKVKFTDFVEPAKFLIMLYLS